jgi:hypothetical protein
MKGTSNVLALNASLQLLPEAGAQRTLEAVSCKALLGAGLLSVCPLRRIVSRSPNKKGNLHFIKRWCFSYINIFHG